MEFLLPQYSNFMQPKLYYRKLGLSDYFDMNFFLYIFGRFVATSFDLFRPEIENISCISYFCACAMWCAAVNFCVEYASYSHSCWLFSFLQAESKFFSLLQRLKMCTKYITLHTCI